MRLEDITVEVRDRNLNRLGLIRPEELDLEVVDYHNNVGTWQLSLATEHPLASSLRAAGSGIIVTGPDNTELFSGPTIKSQAAATATDPAGTITFEGVDDTIILADALAFPQPSNADPTTQTASHHILVGKVETLMHEFVRLNIGPGGAGARKNPRLAMGANPARGATVTKSARFKVLGNLLSELAVTADLGFRVVQRGTSLVFETYAVSDRSGIIRLDVYNNTLAGHKVAISPPGATRVIVAGQNQGADRTFREVTTAESVAAEASWGRRIERFVDQRQTDDIGELDQAGKEVLAEEGFTAVAVQAVPMEDSAMAFGIDWGVGDRVSVVVEGQEVTATVSGYILQASSDGFRMGALIGDAVGFDADAATGKRITDTERRVSNLERSEGGTSTSDLLAMVYPVGAIYLSVLATSPATLFGGTWARIQDRFLLAAGSTYAAGTTGGAASKTLSVSELPSHTHGVGTLAAANESGHTHASGGLGTDSQGAHTHGLGRDKDGSTGTAEWVSHSTGTSGSEQNYYGALTTDGGHGHNITGSTAAGSAHTHTLSGATASAGSGAAFSILPPHLAVYVWQRTA